MNKADFNAILDEWSKKVDVKKEEITNNFDKGLLKAAIFCNGEAKKNAMAMIYNTPIPTSIDGKPLWKRTGLYKAAMGYGMEPGIAHSAVIYNSAPYAKVLEYGSSRGIQGKSILSNSVFNNKENIKNILEKYLKEVVK